MFCITIHLHNGEVFLAELSSCPGGARLFGSIWLLQKYDEILIGINIKFDLVTETFLEFFFHTLKRLEEITTLVKIARLNLIHYVSRGTISRDLFRNQRASYHLQHTTRKLYRENGRSLKVAKCSPNILSKY